MSRVMDIPILLSRQALATAAAAAATSAAADDAAPEPCTAGNDYDGRIGVRISALFVILITSSLGATFPVFAARHRGIGVPAWAFFIAKYFGSGVIIATAFIHLLAPANEALGDSCLTGPITEYSWVEGIALMAVFVLFFTELLAMRYANFGDPLNNEENGHDLSPKGGQSLEGTDSTTRQGSIGVDHLGHSRSHTANELEQYPDIHVEDYAAQVTAVFILEFGVVFHSVFVGLTLAVAGSEFKTLYVVLVFHQTFEGLGLGSRLAAVAWPKDRRWTPYILALGYGLSTPISIAIGLGVRNAYTPGSQTALIVNGVFDSISAGILIYTGLVELMAHEFMFSPSMRRAPISTVMAASGLMCLGAGLMALLGKWA